MEVLDEEIKGGRKKARKRGVKKEERRRRNEEKWRGKKEGRDLKCHYDEIFDIHFFTFSDRIALS